MSWNNSLWKMKGWEEFTLNLSSKNFIMLFGGLFFFISYEYDSPQITVSNTSLGVLVWEMIRGNSVKDNAAGNCMYILILVP